MKQNKESLFKNYDNAEIHLQNMINHRDSIWHNRGAYNYTVQVPYEHKYKVKVGGISFSWVWKTETRWRPEVRFNQQKYDTDWYNATLLVNQAQQNLDNHRQVIINEIDLMRRELSSKNLEIQQIQNLKIYQNTLKEKLSQTNIDYCNKQQTLLQQQNKLNVLQTQSFKIKNNLNELPNEIQSIQQSIDDKNSQIQVNLNILKNVQKEELNQQLIFEKMLSQKSELERSYLAYETIASNQVEVFELIAKHGFLIECLADIAFTKKNWEVFDFCLEMGVDFDNYLVSENGLCLVNKILLQASEEIISKMLDHQNGALTNSIMQACTNGYMGVIKKLYQYDKELFQKNYIGVSVLQAGIWNKNHELVEYIAKYNPEVMKGKTCNGESYFHLALRYESSQIIEIIAKNVDIKEECMLILQSVDSKSFELVIKHELLTQNELKEFFYLSIKNYQTSFAGGCVESIKDIVSLFNESLIKHDFLAAEYLLEHKSDVFDLEVLNNMLSKYDESSEEYQFIQSVVSQDVDLDNLFMSENTNQEIQNIGEIIHEGN